MTDQPTDTDAAVSPTPTPEQPPHAPPADTQPKITLAAKPDPYAAFATAIIITAVAAVSGLMLRNNPVMADNDGSRWDTIYALVHHGRYEIDLGEWGDEWEASRTLTTQTTATQTATTQSEDVQPATQTATTKPLEKDMRPAGPFRTIDKIRLPNGHFYSSKPPLLPTLMAGVYYGTYKLTGWRLWYPKDQRPEKWNRFAGRIVLFVFNVLPLTVMLILYTRLLRQFDIAQTARAYCLAFAAGGTFLTAYCTTLTNHLPAAFCVFFSLYCIIQIHLTDRRDGKLFLGAGFFAACASAFDFIAALFGIVSFLLVVFKSPRQTAKCYVPVAILPIAASLLTNWLAIGDWKPAYTYFGTDVYEYASDCYWAPENRQGVDGLEQPKSIYFANMTVGHHGILSLTPPFVFAVFGMLVPFTGKMKPLRLVQLAILFLTVGVLAWYTTQTTNYGGMAHGLRWVFWLIPLWLIAMPQVMEAVWKFALLRGFAWLCLIVAVASAGFSVKIPWGPSWIHRILTYTDNITY